MITGTLDLRIRQIREETAEIHSFELISEGGAQLPTASAGSHIDLLLPSGLSRSYSLLDAGTDSGAYRIAVKLEPESRGGSRWLHTHARVGMTIKASAPCNDFPLEDKATRTVLIAGGIGITPMLSMVENLTRLGKPWTLHYAARSASHMAYRKELEHLAHTSNGNGALYRYFTSEQSHMDVRHIVSQAEENAHIYCCGPSKLIDAFVDAGRQRHPDTVHFERFAASQAAAVDGGYQVQLSRSGKVVSVPAGKTMLDALLDAGVDIQYACSQGVCGTCRTRVLSGTPDHRDECLSDDEHATNETIIPCCSGSSSTLLVLDL